MNVKNRFLYLAVLIVLIAVLLQGHRLPSAGQVFDSPLPTPPFAPTPTAVPVPQCHALAIAYVAREHDIPIEKLIAGSYVSNENGEWTSDGKEEWFEFPLIQRRACFVKVSVKDSDMVYGVALDEQGQVVDLEELRASEREAAHAKCGKFDPALCARLPALTSDERVEVAIWLTDIDVGAIYDAVAVGYPASLQPEKGLPFDIGHPDYEKAFREVEDRMSRAYREREEPVMAFLEAKGFNVSYASTTAPVVFAELPRDVISALAVREDVVGIYLLEGQLEDRMNSVAPTIRVPQVWDEGYTGDGIRVAVVEDDPVDFSNQYLDHANGGTGPPEFAWYSDDMLHPTLTAGVIAMQDHPLYQGVAPDVTLYSADAGSYSPQSNIADASDWAINSPNYVDVLNLSFGNSDPPLDFWSRYFDHVVWHHRRTVVAAGNEGEPPPSMGNPDSGYNVLTVGGFDDHDSPDWSDDTMSDFSSYDGPGSRDKPEVVAVANNICTTDLSADDVGCEDSLGFPYGGTSLAAPQVSGLAALLMQRTGQERKPELMKAIIMASAVHNIEGNSKLSDKDGAGGIDAALAYAVADHGRYGVATEGWYDYDTVYSSDFDGGGYLHYYVPMSRGERVRVVLAYNSPDSTDPYNNDQLYSDLDLYVRRPSDTQIAASSSVVNNFEIVEFIADETGTYDVRVKKYSWNTTYEYIGIAWVKDATYLPDLRNKDGWVSEFYVRNDGAEPRNVTIHYFDTNGNPTPQGSDTCSLSPNQRCWISVWDHNRIPYGTTGSAIVSGREDVSVVVETKKGAGSGLVAEGYSGFSQGETEAHFPTVGNRSSEWSEISVMNADSETANVTLRFRDRDGYEQGNTQSFSLEPNGKRTTDLRYVGLPADFLGSAYVSLNKRIVAEATTHFSLSPVNDSAAYEGLATGSTGSLYFPQVKRRMFGGSWYDYSGIVVQNLDENNPAGVYVYFYDRNGDLVTSSSFYDSIPRKSSHGYNTRYDGQAPPGKMAALGDDFNGSVRVVSSSGREIMGVCKTWIEGGVDAIEMYVGEGGGASELVVPLVYRLYSGSVWQAYTGVIVQNLGGSDADVTVHFYRQDGSEVTDASFGDTISPNSPHGYNTRYYGDAPAVNINALGYDFVGSMRIEATNGQPLIGVVDVGLESKAVYYYNAVQR